MTNPFSKNVLIIGGGPAGLGAALMLAKRGWTDINVIEKRPSADYYEPDRSFSYQIDGRGQKFTDLFDLTRKLADVGVPNTEFRLVLIKSDGTRKTRKRPIADPDRKSAYWLSRASFMRLLYDEIEENWQASIQVLFRTECIGVKRNANRVEVITRSDDGETTSFQPNLLLGCDGLNSIVRHSLHQQEGGSRDFAMRKYPSPSGGLTYRILTFPAYFPLSEAEGDIAEPTIAYALRSSFKGRSKALSLGFLPVKDPSQPRTANIIASGDHHIWQLDAPERVQAFLKEAFPQLPFDRIVSWEEIERFTESRGGQFPTPQYCSGFYKIFGAPAEERGTAIVLLGDAVHCFPPDIGQGVNSTLEEIRVLYELLTERNNDLSQALPRFQAQREPDVKALIRLVQVSYPWQYNQDPFRRTLWSVDFFLRSLLNRVVPFLFSPHSFVLVRNQDLSYSEVLARVNRTTRLLWSSAGVTVLILLVTLFR